MKIIGGSKTDSFTLFLALLLFVFGTKVILISLYGSPVPYLDQWDAEAANLYIPYLNHDLSFGSLFASHNEHRIFLTRILALILFELAGEWDPILEMLVNAFLHAFAVALFTKLLMRSLPSEQRLPLVVFSALVFSLPIGWENLLAGFQSPFYLLLIFSTLCMAGFSSAPAFSVRWLASLVAGIAAYFSMASGTFTFISASAVVFLQIILGMRKGTREWTSAGVLLAIGVTCLLFVARVPEHDPLKAQSISDFVIALAKLAGFPLSIILDAVSVKNAIARVLAITALHGPLIWFAFLKIRKRPGLEDSPWLIIGLSIWVASQMILLAYGRAVAVNSSRYLDLVLFLIPLNYVALSSIRCEATPAKIACNVRLIRSLWSVITLISLFYVAIVSSFPATTDRRHQADIQKQNVEAYLTTGDASVLEGKPFLHIPYPSANRLAMLLSNRVVRAFLPASIRPADSDVQEMRMHTLLKGKRSARVSRTKEFILNNAALILAFGIAIFFISLQEKRSQLSEPDWKRFE